MAKNDTDIENLYNNTISCKSNVNEEKCANSYEQDDLKIKLDKKV